MADPVFDPIERQTKTALAFGSDRVVKAQTLDKAAIAPVTAVGRNHIKKGPGFCATPRQTKNDHKKSLQFCVKSFRLYLLSADSTH
jgi:hypothetical protein